MTALTRHALIKPNSNSRRRCWRSIAFARPRFRDPTPDRMGDILEPGGARSRELPEKSDSLVDAQTLTRADREDDQ